MTIQMANLQFADHNVALLEDGDYKFLPAIPELRDLPLEELRKIFSFPTIITNENLRLILPDESDRVFDDIIGISSEQYFFKKTAHRNSFWKFINRKAPGESPENATEHVIPIFSDGKFEKFLNFKMIYRYPVSSIIAIMMIYPLSARSFDPGILRDIFGLTLAESRVAICLHMGLTVHDAAAQAGVRVSTVRDQLSSIFSKTGTSRQSELISIFSRLELVL
jgi:DNA-binding CsgD family transcriptional regulator